MPLRQIDRDELRAGFLKLGEKLSEQDIDAIMELADDDGDDSIDITEFERMGEMTKQAVSSVEVKFADLLAKVERCVPTAQPVVPNASVSSIATHVTCSSLRAKLLVASNRWQY